MRIAMSSCAHVAGYGASPPNPGDTIRPNARTSGYVGNRTSLDYPPWRNPGP